MSLVKRRNSFPFILEDILGADWLGGTAANVHKIGFNTPAVNIRERDQAFVLEIAAPGLQKSDFNIELDNEVLTISASVEKEEAAKEKYSRKEFSYTNFKRVFTLPDTVNSSEILASYEQGILLVQLPKKEEAQVQPKRLIEIA